MRKVAFGDTSLKLSVMGLGLAALGRPGYINLGHSSDLPKDYNVAVMRVQTHQMLNAAYDAGINYFDAAQSYGKAESFLSDWLKKQVLTDVIVGSKWGYYYTADWAVNAEHHEIKEHTIERLRLQWPESKYRLDPNLKIYQIHSATLESGVLDNVKVLEELERIKSSGYVIGLSLSGPNQGVVLAKALKVCFDGRPLFGAVQATFNCLEPSAGPMLKRASDSGLGVIVKEGVANGRLTSRNSHSAYYPVLSSIANRHGVGVDAIVLAHILSKSYVDVVLSGAARPEHLKSNLQAVELQLTNTELSILDALRMDSQDYWGERGSLEWN